MINNFFNIYHQIADFFWRIFGRNPFFTLVLMYTFFEEKYSEMLWLIITFFIWAACKNFSENYNSYNNIKRLVDKIKNNTFRKTVLPEHLEKIYINNIPRKRLFKDETSDIELDLRVLISDGYNPPMAFPNHTEASYIILPSTDFLKEHISTPQKFLVLHEVCHCIGHTMHYEGLEKTYSIIYRLFIVFLVFLPIDISVKSLLILYFIAFVKLREFLYEATFESKVDLKALAELSQTEIRTYPSILLNYYDKKINILRSKKDSEFSKIYLLAMRMAVLKSVMRMIKNTQDESFLDKSYIKRISILNKDNYLKVLVKSNSEGDSLNLWFLPFHTFAFYILHKNLINIPYNAYYILVAMLVILMLLIFFFIYDKRANISREADTLFNDLEEY